MSRNQFMALRAERDSVILALQVLPDDPNNHFYRFANNVLQVLCDLNAVELLPMLIQEVEKNPRAAVADTVPNDARSDSSFYYLIPTAILVLLHQEEWKVRPANDTTAQPKDVYDYVRDLYDKRGEEEKGKWEKNDVIYTVELEQDILRIAREFMNTVPEEKRKGAKGMPSSPRFR